MKAVGEKTALPTIKLITDRSRQIIKELLTIKKYIWQPYFL
jgi:hypothetical protein